MNTELLNPLLGTSLIFLVASIIVRFIYYPKWTALVLVALLAVSCGQLPGSIDETTNETNGASEVAESGELARPAGWMAETHSNDAEPNYDVVFPQNRVNQMTITISPENWEAMQANMTELLGEPGQGGFGGPGGFGGRPPEGFNGQLPEGFVPPEGFDGELPEEVAPPEGFQPPAGGDGPGDLVSENPMWVEATIEFNGLVWTNVGVRYKGNSSLASAWRSGDDKMPLKLDFDEFEDEYPEIDNQRFYGFKQLSLANGFSDDSLMRETVAYDLLAEAGLPAAETAFYEILLDHGDGPQSLGVYIAVEVVDDTVINRVFGSDDGNIYEGDGAGVSLAEGSQSQIEDSFLKENNAAEADWSDIEALYEALHADSRISDPAAWRAELEARLNVPDFLHWLALSAAIQHWDTYGGMTHNFYLYHDPATEQLQWISWDHNQVLGSVPGGGVGGPGGRGSRGQVPLDKTAIGDNWPLISYLIADPVYSEMYIDYLREVADQIDPDVLAARYQAMAALLQPYAAADVGADTFATAVQALTDATYQRAQLLDEFLANR